LKDCPYCGKPNEETAGTCRHCGHDLSSSRGQWQGPEWQSGKRTASDIRAANEEWDPARRFSKPRSMSGYAPPANHPSYLAWAVSCLFLFFPTAIVAILLGLKVRERLAKGQGDRAFRYSQMAKIWCFISSVLGVAVYVGVFFLILRYVRQQSPYGGL
jgi:hypothetical protein